MCRETMAGSLVSVQKHGGEYPFILTLCEVVVIGKRLNYGKKTMSVLAKILNYGKKQQGL